MKNKILKNIKFSAFLFLFYFFITCNPKFKDISRQKELEELLFGEFNNSKINETKENLESETIDNKIEPIASDKLKQSLRSEKTKKKDIEKKPNINQTPLASKKKTGTEVTLYTNTEIKNPEDIAKLLAESGKALEEFFKSDAWNGNINNKCPFLNVSQTKTDTKDITKDIYCA
jgi:hypothetical protein